MRIALSLRGYHVNSPLYMVGGSQLTPRHLGEANLQGKQVALYLWLGACLQVKSMLSALAKPSSHSTRASTSVNWAHLVLYVRVALCFFSMPLLPCTFRLFLIIIFNGFLTLCHFYFFFSFF